MTTRSGAVSVAAIVAATVVGVVLIAGPPGRALPLAELEHRLGPARDNTPGAAAVEPPAHPPPPAIAPPAFSFGSHAGSA